MPPSIGSIIVVPIKPIPRVSTFASDITTPNRRNPIRGELKDWKADVVLNDGGPNVGTAWFRTHTAGTFVTKVFRSADYNNIMWVFNQLFGKVEATKQPSSRFSGNFRSVPRFSCAEETDLKSLDLKHVFEEFTATPIDGNLRIGVNAQANVVHPAKKRRQRDGYSDGDYTFIKAIGLSCSQRTALNFATLGHAGNTQAQKIETDQLAAGESAVQWAITLTFVNYETHCFFQIDINHAK